jgi:hypothetical protein
MYNRKSFKASNPDDEMNNIYKKYGYNRNMNGIRMKT